MDTQEILNQISNKKNLNIEQTQFLFRNIIVNDLDIRIQVWDTVNLI